MLLHLNIFILMLFLDYFTTRLQALFKTVEIKVYAAGHIKIGITMKYYNFYYPDGIRNCDYSSKCDPIIIQRVCPLDPVSGHTVSKEKAGGWPFKSCERNENTMKNLGYCAILKYLSTDVNMETFELWDHMAYSTTTFYTEYFEFTVLMMDDDGAGKCTTYMHIVKRSMHTFYRKLLEVKFHFRGFLYQSMVISDFMFSCPSDWHGEHCFYECVDNERHICVDGMPICMSPWSYSKVNYTLVFLKSKVIEIEECFFYNRCLDDEVDECPNNKPYCFPSANASSVCVNIQPVYKSNFDPKATNVSSSIAFVNEVISCEYLVTGGKVRDDKAHSSWLQLHDVQGVVLLFNNKFKVVATHDPNISVALSCYTNFATQDVTLFFVKAFRIFKLPEIVMLGNPNEEYRLGAYLGQNLECLTDGWPQINNSVRMVIISRNFKINDSYTTDVMPIRIPDDAELGFLSISCDLTANFDWIRPKRNFNRTLHIGLKSFVYFHWLSTNKDVYQLNDFVGCVFKAFALGRVTIRQTKGQVILNLSNPAFILLDVSILGAFHLRCYLEFEFNQIIYSKLKEFDVFKVPDILCFQIFPPIRGSIVRCNHDGFPDDIYKLRIFIHDSIDSQTLAFSDLSNSNQVRIPYVLYRILIIVICNLSTINHVNPISLKHSVSVKLEAGSRSKVYLSKEFMDCQSYGDVPDKNDISLSGEREYLFLKGLATLEAPNSVWVVSNNIISISLSIMAIFVILLYKYLRQGFSNYSTLMTKRDNHKMRNCHRHRTINEAIISKAREFLYGDRAAVMLLFEKNMRAINMESMCMPQSLTTFTQPGLAAVASVASSTVPTSSTSSFTS